MTLRVVIAKIVHSSGVSGQMVSLTISSGPPSANHVSGQMVSLTLR